MSDFSGGFDFTGFILIYLVFIVILLAGWWKVYEKAGRPRLGSDYPNL